MSTRRNSKPKSPSSSLTVQRTETVVVGTPSSATTLEADDSGANINVAVAVATTSSDSKDNPTRGRFTTVQKLRNALQFTITLLCRLFKIRSRKPAQSSDSRISHIDTIAVETEHNMTVSTEVASVTLQDGVNAEGSLYRIKKGFKLRLIPSSSLLGKEVALYTNFPINAKSQFVRTQYNSLVWYSKTGEQLTTSVHPYVTVFDIDVYCEVHLNRSGTYHFYFNYKDSSTEKTPNGALYVQVEPLLHVGPPGAQKAISLDSIRCQTYLSKCLGPINTWESKLRVAKESGYNMIHLTPIQELGGSRSCYSLRNQLKLNPDFAVPPTSPTSKTPGKGHPKPTFDDIDQIIKKCRHEWGIVSICDIVLNHTANESDWLKEHPEATYSCYTMPHLRPAFLFDACLTQCGHDIHASVLDMFGVPKLIECEDHLQALKYQLHTIYLPKVNIFELYQCNVNNYVNKFVDEMRKRPPPIKIAKKDEKSEIKIIQDPEYRRLQSTIDFELALELYNTFRPDCFDEDSRLKKCAESFRQKLDELNEAIRVEIQGYLNNAIENCLAGVRYERVQENGPMVREISTKHPIFTKYFTHIGLEGKTLSEVEEAMYTDLGKFFMAHNGWVMNSDPLADFARPQTGRANVYIKRELVAWGDSVKLRFGDKPDDNPYLWSHMKKYVELTAKIFDGVRLDNCHSTPLHVAEYMLDAARQINPELYVVAELFTNSDQTDNIFVNRLGITSLIREAQSAWDSHEEGRLVYRYGGVPVGAFFTSRKRPLAAGIAHALFLDLTHDNPCPVEKRSVFDLLPSAALVSMASCATGSNRGYDELVPHHIHVVDEERQYQEWEKGVRFQDGIIAAKRALNLLHGELAEQGFNQVFVDQMDPNIVAVTRHSPTTHQSVILVAHTAFSYPNPSAGPTAVRPLRFEGNIDEIILEAELTHTVSKPYEPPQLYKMNDKYINGLTEYKLNLREHIPLCHSKIFRHVPTNDGNITQLDFENLRPGSVIAIRVSLHQYTRPYFAQLQENISAFHRGIGKNLDDLRQIISKLDLVDVNTVLFKCDAEERDLGLGGGTYDLPGFGPLVYCGLQGFVSLLTEISPKNDLGHPFCNNLRMGNWMIDYISNRLSLNPKTIQLSKWFESNLEPLKQIPRYLIPAYFDVIITGVYDEVVQHCLLLMSDFLKNGTSFPQMLALASTQFLATVPSADLPKLSPNLRAPKPPSRCVTLAAGLPHFATGYMRCWGRDTFIALRGLMFLTGRYDEARFIILGFAGCLRHGLIPNLLDNGTKPRFNCRDAIWWWLYSIEQYVKEAPNGKDILKDKVSRLFPNDDSEAKKPGEYEQHLYDVIQEALHTHFQGLIYRERNAGTEIDAHMKDPGFTVQIGVHPDTGFVFGGNEANCGTWMDKMGSSEKAGNRGKPSTPRDGTAIELVGLQMSVLRFMQHLSEQGVIPFKSVERSGKNGQKTVWTYKEWADKIKLNFEDKFYVGHEGGPLVNKKGIYKDSFGSSLPWTDFQLRCNFPIAMVAAPEMFEPLHAWEALEHARNSLLGPLGMKTLDPDDWAYRGSYDNSNDGTDPSVAHGANYHQGPEWVWPIGFYLRARLIFAKHNGKLKETIAETWSILTVHLNELQTSHWRGLPELTNEDGAYCSDSCRTQAWSIATVLEVLYDLRQLEDQI